MRNGADLVYVKSVAQRNADGSGYKGNGTINAAWKRHKAHSVVGFLGTQGAVAGGIAGIARLEPEAVAQGVRDSGVRVIQCLDTQQSLQLIADCNLTMSQFCTLARALSW